MAAPVFDEYLGLAERVEDLTVEEFSPEAHRHTDLPNCIRNRLSLPVQHFNLPQLRYDLFRITRGLDGVIGVPARLLITQCNAAGLAAMNEHIDLAARQLATCDCDVVIYICTSGSFMDGNTGDAAIRKRLAELTGKPSMSTSLAVLAALTLFQLKRVVMLTPYDEDLTRREVQWLAANRIEVVDFHFHNIPENLDRGTQIREELCELAKRLRWRDADGIFLSCANVPYLDIITLLEEHTGKPVVTSSTATTLMALRMAGVREPIEGFGQLLSTTSELAA